MPTSKQNSSKAASSSSKTKASVGSKKSVAQTMKDNMVDEPIIKDERMKKDLTCAILVVIALILFVMAILPNDGVLSGVLSLIVHQIFGIGCYVFPFFLIMIALTFVMKKEQHKISKRLVVGLCLIFVGILTLLAVLSPTGVETIFDSANMGVRGGLIGACLGWVFLKLTGAVASYVICGGLIAVGLVLVGFSMTRLFDKAAEKKLAKKQKEELLQFDEPAPQSAPVKPKFGPAKKHDTPMDMPANQPLNQSFVPQNPNYAYAASYLPPQMPSLQIPILEGNNAQQGNPYAQFDEEAPAQDTSKHVDTEQTAKPGKDTKGKNAGAASDNGSDPKASGAPLDSLAGLGAPANMPEEGYVLPPFSLLHRSVGKGKDESLNPELYATMNLLQKTLKEFNVNAEVVGMVPGPTVTLYKLDMPSGVSVKRVSALADDIQLALATTGVRIFAPIPGTNFVGVEVPNKTRQTVLLGDVLKDAKGTSPLMISIGKDVQGNSVVVDLAKMPHLLIAGTTGSGKSVSIHSMLISILMRATPDDVRFILIDPKRVEFIPYNGIPHLYVDVVTEPKEASNALSWCVAEMERRLRIFSANNARNIVQFNHLVEEGLVDPKDAIKQPYIVVAIDELADLMMSSGKEVEFSICRLAQLARAAGIHLIVATQRPDAKTVTGLIRSNITNRIALKVGTGNDSRIILDTPGAENLVGHGDLLFKTTEGKPQRLQAPLLSDEEIETILQFLKDQNSSSEYHPEILKTNLISLGNSSPNGNSGQGGTDELLWDAAEFVISSGVASTSGIQRHFSVGYARAGRIMDMLEEKGIVGPQCGAKPRDILVDAQGLEDIKQFEEEL